MGSSNRTLKVWDPENGKVITLFTTDAQFIATLSLPRIAFSQPGIPRARRYSCAMWEIENVLEKLLSDAFRVETKANRNPLIHDRLKRSAMFGIDRMKLSEEEFLFQRDLQQLLSSDFESENWITAYHSFNDSLQNGAFFSALVPDEMLSSILRKDSWDISIGSGGPDVCISCKDGIEVARVPSLYRKGADPTNRDCTILP